MHRTDTSGTVSWQYLVQFSRSVVSDSLWPQTIFRFTPYLGIFYGGHVLTCRDFCTSARFTVWGKHFCPFFSSPTLLECPYCITLLTPLVFKTAYFCTSLVVQWLRTYLPVQGTQVQSLVQEDCTHTTGQLSLCAMTTEPVYPRAHALQQERPLQWEAHAAKSSPHWPQLQKAQAKHYLIINYWL